VRQPEGAEAIRSRTGQGRMRWCIGLSLGLHVGAVVALLLSLHPLLTQADQPGSVELVMVPAVTQELVSQSNQASTTLPVSADQEPNTEPASEPTQTPPAPQNLAAAEPAPPPPPVPPPVSESSEPPPPQPAPKPPSAAPRPPVPAAMRSRSVAKASPEPVSKAAALPAATQRFAQTPAAAGVPASPAAQPQQTALIGADPAWLAGVSAWLLAHRTYPQIARERGQQGTVVMQITVDPEGHVVDVALVRGSGTDSLDHAAETLVRNAQLPPFPANMRMARQSLTIPIHYRLE
jgi:protein TonB